MDEQFQNKPKDEIQPVGGLEDRLDGKIEYSPPELDNAFFLSLGSLAGIGALSFALGYTNTPIDSPETLGAMAVPVVASGYLGHRFGKEFGKFTNSTPTQTGTVYGLTSAAISGIGYGLGKLLSNQ